MLALVEGRPCGWRWRGDRVLGWEGRRRDLEVRRGWPRAVGGGAGDGGLWTISGPSAGSG